MKKAVALSVLMFIAIFTYARVPRVTVGGKTVYESTKISKHIPEVKPRPITPAPPSASLADKLKSEIIKKTNRPDFKAFTPPVPQITDLNAGVFITYRNRKKAFLDGKFENKPDELLSLACEAEAHNEPATAIACATSAFKSGYVTSKHLLTYRPKSERLLGIWRAEARNNIDFAYAYRISGDSVIENTFNVYDSEPYKTDMAMAKIYAPALTPLLKIFYTKDIGNATDLYAEALDSIIANPDAYTTAIRNHVITSALSQFFNSKRFDSALDYFEQKPLKSYSDTITDFQLDLASCAFAARDNDRFTSHLARAYRLDSLATEQYWTNLYDEVATIFLNDPALVDTGKWVIENNDYPVEAALWLTGELLERYWPEDGIWEWDDVTNYAPKQLAAHQAIIPIIDLAIDIDNGSSPRLSVLRLRYLEIARSAAEENQLASAVTGLHALVDDVSDSSLEGTNDLRCWVALSQAYQAGHGLDKPKEAFKILKKNVKLLNAEEVNTETKSTYYDYMATLCAKLGKQKDAAKYQNLRQGSNF